MVSYCHGGGDSWAQTLTKVTSLNDINETDTYVLQYNGGYFYTGTAYFYAASATANSISCSLKYDLSNQGYIFKFKKITDGIYQITNELTQNYLTSGTYFRDDYTNDWAITCTSGAFCLAWRNTWLSNTEWKTNYKVLYANGATSPALISGVSVTKLSTYAYTNIYKVEKVETVNVTVNYYNEDGTLIVSKAHTTNKGEGTLSSLLETIPSYITSEYYDVTGGSETTADPSAKIEQNSKFKVVTKYNNNFQYPQSKTEYFTLRSLHTDNTTHYYLHYYLGTSSGITTPTYRNRKNIALRIDGDWYNGYSIISYDNKNLWSDGTGASFDSGEDYKWKIDNNNRFVNKAGRYLQVKETYFTTTTYEDYAAKLASTEAVEPIKNSAPEGYVGSLDKRAAEGITFDDLIKDKFKLALEVGKYYFIETADDPTKAISSAEVAYIYGSSTLASNAQKIKTSHSFPELWKYASDKQFVNANTDYYLAPSGNLTHAFSGWEDPFQLEVTNNDETVFQMKVSSGSYIDKYLEIFNKDEVKATRTAPEFKGWRFRLAESIDINLTKNGDKSYATTCAPVAVTLSKDDAVNTTLYIEKSHTESSLSVVKAEAVAANTGIYVMNTEGATSATLLLANSGEASQANDAILKGTTITQDISSADHSLLRTLGFIKIDEKDQIGFFKPASTIKAIPANRAYLRLSNISQTNAFYIDFDGTTTSINELLPATEAQDNAPIYDLSGRRMQGTLHKGIYIQNGRKFMVK